RGLPHRLRERAEDRGARRSGRRRVSYEGPGARRHRRRAQAGCCVSLTTENTAIVVDSTADFPNAHERYPNWRVVPLYVNFGTESFRDGVDLSAHEFYERLRTAPELPTTSQPTPAEFLARGGRIGRAKAFAGQLMNVKPILSIRDAEVVPVKRVRGNRKAFQEFVDTLDAQTRDEPGLRVGIAHADAPERMEEIAKMV